MVTRHTARLALALGFLATSFVGCRQLLNMEDGHLDPTLGADAVGGGASGSAGSESRGAAGGEVSDAGMSGGPEPSSDEGGAAGARAAGDGEGGASGGQPATDPASLCDDYCNAVMSGCTQEHAQYIDFAACRTSCEAFPAGEPDARDGNSINCRLTYARKAPSEPYTYCTWAGPGGAGKCGTNCEGFCTLMVATCTAQTTEQASDYFASASACKDTCQGLNDIGGYSATDPALQVGADHVQCRLYHVGAAIAEEDPITHCGHAMGHSLCFDSSE